MATPIDDDTLQRFYDGDLSPLEEHSVQARIENDPAAQQRLAQLSELTSQLRGAAEELAQQVDSAALFAGIEAKLASSQPLGFGARMRLVTSEWAEHRRAALVPLMTAGAVAAATLLLVLRPGEYGGPEATLEGAERTGGQSAEPAANEPVAPPSTDSPEQLEARVTHGSRVENVDFGDSTGTVFEIEDEGVAVAVVWISDEEETP